MFIHTHPKSTIAALLMLTALVAFFVLRDNGTPSVSATPSPVPHILVAASTTPLSVEGVIVSQEESVIAAQTSGRLASVPALEGRRVARGEVLAVVGQPVLAAERDQLLARMRATEAQRSLAEVASGGQVRVAEETVRAGEVIADTEVVASKASLEAKYSALLTTLESAYQGATEALNFLADTSSIASTDVRDLRLAAVRTLAGTEGTAYLGDMLRTGNSTEGVLNDLYTLRTGNPDTTRAELMAAVTRVSAGVDTLADAFDAAERTAYARGGAVTAVELAQYNSYRTSVRALQASLVSGQSAYEAAEKAYGAARVSLTENKAVQSADLSRAQEVRASESGVSSATLRELQAQLNTLDTSLGEAVVRAPYSGVVTEVLVDRGDYVSPGRPLVRIHSVSGYEVEVVVAPQYLPAITIGSAARFVGSAVGVVNRASPEVKAGVGGASVFITLESAAEHWVPGMRVRGELLLAQQGTEQVFAVPHPYVSFDFSGPVVRTSEGTMTVGIVRDTQGALYIQGDELREGMELLR